VDHGFHRHTPTRSQYFLGGGGIVNHPLLSGPLPRSQSGSTTAKLRTAYYRFANKAVNRRIRLIQIRRSSC
jgi:hypothetical protein